MFHSLMFYFSGVVLILGLIAAGWLSGLIMYYLGAALVLVILAFSTRSK
jgi:hypothetical protein